MGNSNRSGNMIPVIGTTHVSTNARKGVTTDLNQLKLKVNSNKSS
jgi:hypothetical protein